MGHAGFGVLVSTLTTVGRAVVAATAAAAGTKSMLRTQSSGSAGLRWPCSHFCVASTHRCAPCRSTRSRFASTAAAACGFLCSCAHPGCPPWSAHHLRCTNSHTHDSGQHLRQAWPSAALGAAAPPPGPTHDTCADHEAQLVVPSTQAPLHGTQQALRVRGVPTCQTLASPDGLHLPQAHAHLAAALLVAFALLSILRFAAPRCSIPWT